jgi:PTH1 family peptidyl-tRNA hydrolase
MKLIVGLGNPGDAYTRTRHNVGFLVLDALAGETGWSYKKAFHGDVAEIAIGEEKVVLLKPDTYMNESGTAVQAVGSFYKIEPKDIFVVRDEADLAFGDVRVQPGRGSAGHNGMKSIMETFGGSMDFVQVRVGVGRPLNDHVPLDVFVLERWTPEETAKLTALVSEVVEKVKNEFFEHKM